MSHLPHVLTNIATRFGVDKSIAYSSGARVVQAFTGLASIFFIAAFLSKTQQGYYYTFGSIVAIQVFFELGLTGIITQYVAHEMSHLEWESYGRLRGVPRNLSRLAHLVRFSVKWYAIVSIALFFLLLAAGYWFFNYYSPSDDDVSWFIPWTILSIGTALNLFVSPLLAILMGVDKVKEVSKVRFYQQIVQPAVTWVGLALGWNLYVLGIGSIFSVVWVTIFIYVTEFKPILVNLWKERITERVNYMKEIFPYQWRIALSWISGYFIFQLFNPVLFATEGAVVAGQMGMTLTVLNGINAFSFSWIGTKVPLFSKLIARKEYRKLDTTFNMTTRQMGVVCTMMLVVMFVGVWGLRMLELPLGYRFLPYLPMLFMMVALLLNQYVGAWATYLRCHKQEPFLVQSIVVAILCTASTLILGKLYGAYGITAGYFIIVVIATFWGYHIFTTKKNQWHGR